MLSETAHGGAFMTAHGGAAERFVDKNGQEWTSHFSTAPFVNISTETALPKACS